MRTSLGLSLRIPTRTGTDRSRCRTSSMPALAAIIFRGRTRRWGSRRWRRSTRCTAPRSRGRRSQRTSSTVGHRAGGTGCTASVPNARSFGSLLVWWRKGNAFGPGGSSRAARRRHCAKVAAQRAGGALGAGAAQGAAPLGVLLLLLLLCLCELMRLPLAGGRRWSSCCR
jgi:hypothetical protein